MTTTLPNPRPTSTTIGRFRELAAETQGITDSYERFLDDDLPKEWATFMTHALSQTGLSNSAKHNFADLSHGYYPAMTPDADGLTYTGSLQYQGCGDEYDSYTIPWDFIDPSTREAAEERVLADLRQEKADRDAALAKNAKVQAAHQRKQQEKQLEALAASLGKKITDA